MVYIIIIIQSVIAALAQFTSIHSVYTAMAYTISCLFCETPQWRLFILKG